MVGVEQGVTEKSRINIILVLEWENQRIDRWKVNKMNEDLQTSLNQKAEENINTTKNLAHTT